MCEISPMWNLGTWLAPARFIIMFSWRAPATHTTHQCFAKWYRAATQFLNILLPSHYILECTSHCCRMHSLHVVYIYIYIFIYIYIYIYIVHSLHVSPRTRVCWACGYASPLAVVRSDTAWGALVKPVLDCIAYCTFGSYVSLCSSRLKRICDSYLFSPLVLPLGPRWLMPPGSGSCSSGGSGTMLHSLSVSSFAIGWKFSSSVLLPPHASYSMGVEILRQTLPHSFWQLECGISRWYLLGNRPWTVLRYLCCVHTVSTRRKDTIT